MIKSFVSCCEHTSRLYNIFCSSTSPINVGRVMLIENCDLVSVDIKEFAIFLYFTLKLSVGGVILEHVDHVVQRNEGVIDSNNLKSPT